MTVNIHVKKYNPGMEGQEVITGTDRVVEAFEALEAEKHHKDQAKMCRESAVDILTEFHYMTGARDFSIPGKGSVTAYLGESSRFDKAKMGMFLVENGVPSSLVEKAIEAGTVKKVNEKVTVRFKPER